MYEEITAHYENLLTDIGDTISYTVTFPDTGLLTIEQAIHRMRVTPTTPPDHPNSLALYQVGNGVVTLDWTNPTEERHELTDRLAGEGFRHWHVSYDMAGDTLLTARYGTTEGVLTHPEPAGPPFTHWTDHLGPLAHHAAFLSAGYEEDTDLDMTAACLTVVELESGIRLDHDLLETPAHLLSWD